VSERSPRDASVIARSILLVVAAVSVIATSNYFAYLIGRKQVTYETLRRQVDLVVQFMDQKRSEEGLASATVKQRQDRLEQNAPALTGLTTSTINGKTTVVAPERAMPAAPIDDNNEARAQAPDSSLNAVTKGVAHQRGPRRPKVSPTSAAPKRGPAEPAIAEQAAVAPDAGLAGQ
jgi:hypothetical protein